MRYLLPTLFCGLFVLTLPACRDGAPPSPMPTPRPADPPLAPPRPTVGPGQKAANARALVASVAVHPRFIDVA